MIRVIYILEDGETYTTVVRDDNHALQITRKPVTAARIEYRGGANIHIVENLAQGLRIRTGQEPDVVKVDY